MRLLLSTGTIMTEISPRDCGEGPPIKLPQIMDNTDDNTFKTPTDIVSTGKFIDKFFYKENK